MPPAPVVNGALPDAGTSPPGSRRTRVVGGAATAVLGVAVVAGMYVAAVLEPVGRRLDNRILRAASSLGDGFAGILKGVLDVAVALAVLGVVVLAVHAWRRGERRRTVATVAVVALSEVVTEALKVALPAPGWHENSLPSGHVTIALTTVIAAVVLGPRRTRGVLVGGLCGVAAVALGTVLVGWHRPSDVVAAVGVVLLVLGATIAVSGEALARSG